MLPREVKDALDSILGDLTSSELDRKRKKYTPDPEKAEHKPVHGVSITIVTGGKHPEPEGDEPKAEPLESPDELEKLLGDEDGDEAPEKEEPAKPKRRVRRY